MASQLPEWPPVHPTRKGERVVLPLLKGKRPAWTAVPTIPRRLMTSYLVDINVWLALTWDQHPQHAPASDWYRSIDDVMLLFCRFTMVGFLRLLSPTAI